MGAISSHDIISILKEEINDFEFEAKDKEVGTVISVGDGIVTVYGIDKAMYGEIVMFENGVKGMVQDVRQSEMGIILFGSDAGISEGTKVTRTEKKAGISVISLSAVLSTHLVHRLTDRVRSKQMTIVW